MTISARPSLVRTWSTASTSRTTISLSALTACLGVAPLEHQAQAVRPVPPPAVPPLPLQLASALAPRTLLLRSVTTATSAHRASTTATEVATAHRPAAAAMAPFPPPVGHVHATDRVSRAPPTFVTIACCALRAHTIAGVLAIAQLRMVVATVP